MPNTKASEGSKCMNCGAPIKSGFFCAKCTSGETDSKSSNEDGWKGSRFSGEAKRRRQRELLMEDLAIWAKRLLVLAIVAGVGWGGWTMFGGRIKGMMHQGEELTSSHEKYDPTKDAAADVNDEGQKNGHRAFTPDK